MNNLGIVIRDLLDQCGMSQKELAARIKLSTPSLSQIVTGKAKPRQINLTRIMQVICNSPEDEQRVINAYYNVDTVLPDSPDALERPLMADNRERVGRYLEMKIASVRLRQQVEAILLQQGIPYFKDYIRDPVICDFYLPDRKLILECKANPTRDWDRTDITCTLLEKAFPGYSVWILVPEGLEAEHLPPTSQPDRRIVDLRNLSLELLQ